MSGLSPEGARGEARFAWPAEAERWSFGPFTFASFASACVLAGDVRDVRTSRAP